MSPLDSRGPTRTDPQTRRVFESLRADMDRQRKVDDDFRASTAAAIAKMRTELREVAESSGGNPETFIEELIITFGGGNADG